MTLKTTVYLLMVGDEYFELYLWSEHRSRFNDTNAYRYYNWNTVDPCFLLFSFFFQTTRTLKNLQHYIQLINCFIYRMDQRRELMLVEYFQVMLEKTSILYHWYTANFLVIMTLYWLIFQRFSYTNGMCS